MAECPATFEAVLDQEEYGYDGCPICGRSAWTHPKEQPIIQTPPPATTQETRDG